MEDNQINILIFSPSEIILRGLGSIISEAGFDYIPLRKADDLFDYPHLLGFVLVIISQESYSENVRLIEQFCHEAAEISYLFIGENLNPGNKINLNDSETIVQHKIQLEVNSYLDKHQTTHTQELSKREIEVLRLVALGNTNKEIADNLSISTHTVISHRKNLSEKTGVKTISGLTMYAVIKQIVDIKDINTDSLK